MYVHLSLNAHALHVHVHHYTLDWISSSLPMHCRQNRKAETLCLKPPSKELAGLSAEMIVTVPRKCRVSPLITKGTPFSCKIMHVYMYFTVYHEHVHVYSINMFMCCAHVRHCTLYVYTLYRFKLAYIFHNWHKHLINAKLRDSRILGQKK